MIKRILIGCAIVSVCVASIFILSLPKPKPIVPTQTQQVITAYNPIIDSLAKQNFNLKYENDSLKELTYKLNHKRTQVKASYYKEKIKTAVAEAKNDTSALVNSLQQQVADCDEYMQTTDEQLSVQGGIIENQEQIIKNQVAEIDLFKRQIKTAVNENSNLLSQIKIYEKQLPVEKHRKNNWRRVAGGAIAVAIIEGIILSLK